MNKKYPTFFLTWFNKFPRVPSPGVNGTPKYCWNLHKNTYKMHGGCGTYIKTLEIFSNLDLQVWYFTPAAVVFLHASIHCCNS